MFDLLKTLKDRLSYEPETGLFKYRYDFNIMKAGDIAGRPNTNGHIQISINYKRYMAHNLAWLYMTGEYPDGFIVDHIDRVYSNNKWSNLRKSNSSQNQGNAKLRKDNKSGFKGVVWCKRSQRWIAQIGVNGKHVRIGGYVDKEEAIKAYEAEAFKHFGEFANV